jgi:hypothetical protein
VRCTSRRGQPGRRGTRDGALENLKQQLTRTREQLQQQRLHSALLRRSVAELTIEVDLVREQLNAAAKVTVLPRADDRLPARRAFGRVSLGQPASPTLET